MKIVDVPDVPTRIRMAYLEMPEMRLTRGQLRRLLDLSSDDCERALLTLTESGFLIESWDGAFVRSINPACALVRTTLLTDDVANQPDSEFAGWFVPVA